MTESILLDLTKKKFEIWQNQDKEQLQKFFDEHGLFFDLDGQVETKGQIAEKMISDKCVLRGANYQKTIARVYGNSAVVHGEGEFSLSIKGELKAFLLSFLDVWMEREDGWKLVSTHYSLAN
ncbi:nuclear transport factor 2 family protein [Algoriphagus namhaensis]|uniref:Nuclear transport factor 2 family protein n=1 Tax=Algoriphagus namhaensis TaxID=915353 RepID=A0ABV8ASZ2_9BACT